MEPVNGYAASLHTEADYTDFAHTGRGTLAGCYLRRFWQPVYLGRKLPAGHAVSLRVMSEDFTLYRGESGQVYLLDFRCAHRGTQLSTGWVEGDCIRCFYHGWKYDQTGQCVEMPAEDPSFLPKVQIRHYPVEEYLGLIFAYLGEGTPPPFQHWPLFEGDKGLEISCVPRACNYFQNVENTVDEVHVAFVHRGELPIGELVPDRDLPRVSAEETEYGLVQYGVYADGRQQAAHLLMPNCFSDSGVPGQATKQNVWEAITTSPGFREGRGLADVSMARQINVVWRVPVDDVNHNQFAWRFLDVTGQAAHLYNEAWRERERIREEPPTVQELGDAVLAGRMRLEDLEINRFKAIQVQDWVGMVGQGKIADRVNERLGRSDVGIILLRQIWERELRALAEGRLLMQWRWPSFTAE
jgi:5,5'-dehydrodivanillate O-demethylase oxygenase subunit